MASPFVPLIACQKSNLVAPAGTGTGVVFGAAVAVGPVAAGAVVGAAGAVVGAAGAVVGAAGAVVGAAGAGAQALNRPTNASKHRTTNIVRFIFLLLFEMRIFVELSGF
jgi:hypothetical protein